MQEENRSTRRKPAEASMDWKPNTHMAPGLGALGPLVHSAGEEPLRYPIPFGVEHSN